jgi:tetratricopeptide (TPR) repeat protein
MLSAFGWGARTRGDVSRARSLFQEALQIEREIGDDVNTARTLNWLGELAHHAGEYAEARQCYQDSLSISQELGDRWATSLSLDYSGYVARRMGDHAEARRLHQESLAISREVGDQQGVAGSLDNLGLVAYDLGDYTEAQRLFEEGLALRRAAGEAFTIAVSLGHVAGVALAMGDDARAEQALQESLGLEPDWAYALIRLGDLRLAQGNLPEALEHYRQALQIGMRRHDLPVVLDSLTGIAALRAQTGKTDGAAELLAFILNHPASEYATRSKARRLFDEVSVQLPPESLADAEARGQAETLEAVVASV